MAVELAIPHIDAGIVTNDRAAALAFWHETLGFPVEGEISFPGLTIVRLKVGETTLRLCIPDTAAPHLAHPGPFDQQTGLRYLTLAVRNLDAILEKVAAKGYPIPYPAREIRPGTRAAQIQDGAGVTVELMERRG